MQSTAEFSLTPGIEKSGKLTPEEVEACNNYQQCQETEFVCPTTGDRVNQKRMTGSWVRTRVRTDGRVNVKVWNLRTNHQGENPPVNTQETYSFTEYTRPYDRRTEEIITRFLKEEPVKHPPSVPECNDILAEPDRPGQWWWQEPGGDQWKMVVVKRIVGGHLTCDELEMADLEGQTWKGAWWLKSQDAPAYGRAKRIYSENPT